VKKSHVDVSRFTYSVPDKGTRVASGPTHEVQSLLPHSATISVRSQTMVKCQGQEISTGERSLVVDGSVDRRGPQMFWFRAVLRAIKSVRSILGC